MDHINKRLQSYIPNSSHVIQTKIDLLDLSCRAYNCLRRNGIETINELINLMVESNIKNLPYLGIITEKEIELKLIKFLDNNRHLNLKYIKLDKENSTHSSNQKTTESLSAPEKHLEEGDIENNLKPHANEEWFSLDEIEALFVNLNISERNWEIIKLRSFGKTLKYISMVFGVSRERIRQITKRETKKIIARSIFLIEFFDFLERRIKLKTDIQEPKSDYEITVKYFINLLILTIGYDLPDSLCMKIIIVLRYLSQSKNVLHPKNWQIISYFASLIHPIITNHPIVNRQTIERNKKEGNLSYRQLAYKVLSESTQALHWQEIAREAENMGRRKSFNASGLYNSLLAHKDVFVLVDRGTYGLKEWGLNKVEYFTKIIAKILKINKTPLPFGKICFEVNKIRKIKKNSLLMVLDLNPRFYKSTNNTYGLRAWLEERYKQNLLTPVDFVEESKSHERVGRARSHGYNIEEIVSLDE